MKIFEKDVCCLCGHLFYTSADKRYWIRLPYLYSHYRLNTTKQFTLNNLIEQFFYNKDKKNSLTSLYKSLVRPIMEYCSHSWAGAACHLELFNKLQRRATENAGRQPSCRLIPNSLIRTSSVTRPGFGGES